jgi:SAM-dependent methyltransferase
MNATAFVKSLLPQSMRAVIRPHYQRMRLLFSRSYCPVCEQKVTPFVPLPSFYREELLKHGSDLLSDEAEMCNREAYSCPRCWAADRDRLYALYLERRLRPPLPNGFRLLDIAPTKSLSAHIRRKYPIVYRTADLHMEEVDDRVDLTRMDCYADGSFDAFICSHVLEHIMDDRKAMSELYRILKPGGWGIAMVPISRKLKQIREDPSAQTEAERWRLFGQGDHVRIYTRDGFLTRLGETGFRVIELGQDFFGRDQFVRHGITETSMLYIVEK